MSGSKKWFVIVNPTSGNGSSLKKWPKIQQLLNFNDFDFDFNHSEHHNHSFVLAQEAIKNGITNIISVGGDGTLHNIVNGIMSQKEVPSNEVNVGVIPIGTGNDWVKTHNIPKNLERAIQIIKKGVVKQQDIGIIELLDQRKNPVYFNNLAGVGFDGYVANKSKKYKRYGSMAYLVGTLSGLSFYKKFQSTVEIDSTIISSRTLMVLVGICVFSGGGMRLTKAPNPYDGLFDVSIAKNFTLFDIIKNVVKLFNGNIVNHKKVECYNTSAVTIKVDDKVLPFIQADGEIVGKGSMKVTLIPKAFSFYS